MCRCVKYFEKSEPLNTGAAIVMELADRFLCLLSAASHAALHRATEPLIGSYRSVQRARAESAPRMPCDVEDMSLHDWCSRREGAAPLSVAIAVSLATARGPT